jgi:hypothetical protein
MVPTEWDQGMYARWTSATEWTVGSVVTFSTPRRLSSTPSDSPSARPSATAQAAAEVELSARTLVHASVDHSRGSARALEAVLAGTGGAPPPAPKAGRSPTRRCR